MAFTVPTRTVALTLGAGLALTVTGLTVASAQAAPLPSTPILHAVADSSLETTFTDMVPGEELKAGDMLVSPNGDYRAVMQADGNFVIYDYNNKAIWATSTDGQSVDRLVFQTDGNLVMYTTKGKAVWDSKTDGSGANLLALEDDGDLCIYTKDQCIWSTASGTPTPTPTVTVTHTRPPKPVPTVTVTHTRPPRPQPTVTVTHTVPGRPRPTNPPHHRPRPRPPHRPGRPPHRPIRPEAVAPNQVALAQTTSVESPVVYF